MNTAAYHHYAVAYSLVGVILLALLGILVVAAKLHGDRERRSNDQDGHSAS